MSDDELTGLGEDRAWKNARKIWFAGGVDLPDRMNNETAHYLADLASRAQVAASRIAHGVPLGGELEFVDGGTLSHAFYGRRVVE